MATKPQFIGYLVAKLGCPFHFTVNATTGKVIVLDGVPRGTKLRYIEHQHFSDGSFIDSDWITLRVGEQISN